ncbi:WD40 repeat domain-containing protein [Actinomadura rudentiformis]|uniref:WD40 repeat domain-containing protein n=1 Tax=Actinomadura rudentiformis TaxID=359158 RepID=A0A6H9YVD9_9ACTN|nr:WD40 repeat domain-containing protein [Actinomadura rudentiformis]KAB2352597.1 WD40 repeat domain-containing protein [Actinomadura rudentiformis]
MPQPGADELAGSITLAIHARRLTLDDLVTRIADGLGLSAVSVPTLLFELSRRTVSATIMIDALDESGVAEDNEEHLRISEELLRPLSLTPGLRLLVGGRRETLAGLSRHVFHPVELDRGTYADPEDIRRYVAGILADRGDRTVRAVLVNGIAHRAGASFLVARMIVEAVNGGQLDVDPSREGWVRNLPTEAAAAFRSWLGRFGDREPLVRRLLTPLAYALGSGLPWDHVWSPLATALSGRRCVDEDVQWLLNHAGAYIDEVTIADGTTRFRLSHDELSRALREPRREREAQRRITKALIATVPSQPDTGRLDWANAHPYVLAHLATHAAAAQEIDDLIADVGFLCHADLTSLLAALNQVTTTAGQTIAMVFQAVAVRHPDDAAAPRRTCLAFEAARQGASDLLAALNRDLPWQVERAMVTQDHGYRAVLGVEPAAVHLQCVEVLDRQKLLTSSNSASLRMWDLTSGEELDSLGDLQSPGVPAFATAIVEGRPVALAGGLDGAVQLWDLISGAPGAAWPGHETAVNAVCTTTAFGTQVGITKDEDGVVVAWDLNHGTIIATIATSSRLSPMACLEADGREAIAVIDTDLTVQAWDLQSGELLGALCDGRHDIGLVATAEVDGRRLLLTVHLDGVARLWQPGARAVQASIDDLSSEVTKMGCATTTPEPLP